MPLSVCKFGEFELDCSRYELRRRGRPLKLEHIPMELLILLAEKEGSVATRLEITERLWGKDVFVDTEHGINTAIRKIRTALREDGERPRFIQTVQGKGYRLVAEGPNASAGDDTPAPEARAIEAPPTTAATTGARRRLWTAGAMASLLLAGTLLGFNLGGIRDRVFRRNPPARIQSIAVLPLANLSGDPSQEYLADGLTDELITMLAKNTSLRVVSRTSAMQYKGVRRPLGELARELRVDGILEGSVARSGNRVHMTAQLIQADSDTHVWAESYDRDFNDALSLPSELSQTIAKAVRSAAAPPEPPRHVNPEAHDAYLHGRYCWYGGNYDRSQEYFQKAIQLQPDYASAWSGLSDSYGARAVVTTVPAREVTSKAKEAAHKAVELDDTLPEAHNSLAGLYFFMDWDWEGANAESLRAIALNPTYAEARHMHGYILSALNRREEALEEQRRSNEIDPFARPWALGRALIQARQLAGAVDEFRLLAEAQPKNSGARFDLSEAYWLMGSWEQSVQEMEKGLRAEGDETSAAAVGQAFESGGGRAVAEWNFNRAKARARKAYVSPFRLAEACAHLGRKDETLRLLEDAYREHSPRLVFLQVEPIFDFLHSDERYRALVKRVGLPPAYER